MLSGLFKRKEQLYLVLILVLAVVLRFAFLNKIPVGLSNDEIDWVVRGKAIWESVIRFFMTGKPFFLIPPHGNAPAPYLLLALFIGFLPFSLFTAHLLNATISTLFVLLMYLLTKKIFRNEHVALLSALVAAINPWLIFIGRTAFESLLAGFFYFLGLYLLFVLQKNKLYFSLIPFIIAFFAYQGTKFIFLPFIGIALIYSYFFMHERKWKKIFIGIFVAACAVFISYISFFKLFPESVRIDEIAYPFSPRYAVAVDHNRKLSIQTPLLHLYENKPTVFLKSTLEKYLNAFSPSVLFITGDPYFIFASNFSFFYYTDALLIIMGLIFLWKRNLKVATFLTVLILIAPFPSSINTHEVSYIHRATILFPLFFMLIGFALYELWLLCKKQTLRHLFIALFAIVSIFELGNFITNYFFESPIVNPEQWGFTYRNIASYIYRSGGTQRRVVIMTTEPRAFFKQYIFHTNNLNEASDHLIETVSSTQAFSYKNMYFTSCNMSEPFDSHTLYIVDNASCQKLFGKRPFVNVPKLSDGGTLYRIYNDVICSQYDLPQFPSGITYHSLGLETLSNQEYCQTFMTKLPRE